ncbi:hypothetical protein ABZ766_03045 [Streptomyces sp. NPDC006670]|uniref:hypothetical protein n=1 Tax=Streptomyces sp. NPDC006670 TaxID=3154476 RepID=UPI0033D9EEF7
MAAVELAEATVGAMNDHSPPCNKNRQGFAALPIMKNCRRGNVRIRQGRRLGAAGRGCAFNQPPCGRGHKLWKVFNGVVSSL